VSRLDDAALKGLLQGWSELYQTIKNLGDLTNDKIMQLHAFIRQNSTYSITKETWELYSRRDPKKSWFKDFVNIREGSCLEFATFFSLLLKKLGVPSCILYGPAVNNFLIEEEAHTYVQYFVDGKWNVCEPPSGDPDEESRIYFEQVDPKGFASSAMQNLVTNTFSQILTNLQDPNELQFVRELEPITAVSPTAFPEDQTEESDEFPSQCFILSDDPADEAALEKVRSKIAGPGKKYQRVYTIDKNKLKIYMYNFDIYCLTLWDGFHYQTPEYSVVASKGGGKINIDRLARGSASFFDQSTSLKSTREKKTVLFTTEVTPLVVHFLLLKEFKVCVFVNDQLIYLKSSNDYLDYVCDHLATGDDKDFNEKLEEVGLSSEKFKLFNDETHFYLWNLLNLTQTFCAQYVFGIGSGLKPYVDYSKLLNMNIEALNISRSHKFILNFDLSRLKKLTNLFYSAFEMSSLSRCTGHISIDQILQLNNLEKLEIMGTEVKNFTKISMMSRLRDLRIERCKIETSLAECIETINKLKKLTHLSLEDFFCLPSISEQSSELPPLDLPDLTSISLKLPLKNLNPLLKLKNLKKISLHFERSEEELESVENIDQFPKLKSFICRGQKRPLDLSYLKKKGIKVCVFS
jgi:hypothetical protein